MALFSFLRFRDLTLCSLLMGLSAHLRAAEPPNVLVILLDDFGIGQFSPMVRNLEIEDLDPGFLAYTAEQPDAYDPQAFLKGPAEGLSAQERPPPKGALFPCLI